MEITTTPVFLKNYTSKKKIKINRGGTRSGKTYNILEIFHLWLTTWKIAEHLPADKAWILTIVRKFAATLKGTVIRDFEEIIDKHESRRFIEINKTDRTYKFKNRIVEFIWADDQQKLRGWKRNYLYCNEANELNFKQEFFQLLIRTEKLVFLDFNPDDEDVWINTELEQKRALEKKDIDIIISTYRDNPFLSAEQVAEIEYLEHTDPAYWKIYWLWEYWRLEGLIFENWKEIGDVPKEANFLARWQDFWFTNDPTTLIAVYKWNWALVLDEELWQHWLTNQDIVWEFKMLWFEKALEIFWDSAEPKSIEEIYRWGYNIKPVTKWPDSIKFWLDLMKQQPIYITARSINLKKEFKKYIWAKDKEGKPTNKPIDKFNHWIDAVRYACMMKLKTESELSIFIW